METMMNRIMNQITEGVVATLGILAMVFVVTTFIGCSDKNDPVQGDKRDVYSMENVCLSDTSKDRHDFILDCIKNGNPYSDEEPEDWITECEEMAENLYCLDMTVRRSQEYNGSQWITFKKAIIAERIEGGRDIEVRFEAKGDQDQ
jgi:hypothetical protein